MSEVLVKILDDARVHADRLAADILLARTRDEHVRVTARANEAAHVVVALENLFENGEVLGVLE